MANEIERKFLVANEAWRSAIVSESHLMQGYLASQPGLTVRVRLADGQGILTIKGATEGITRQEYEYAIPAADAKELLQQLARKPIIDKVRYQIKVGDHTWELDVFEGENKGLVLAEIELTSEDESFQLPEWAGKEVSDDARYYNANLARNPFNNW